MGDSPQGPPGAPPFGAPPPFDPWAAPGASPAPPGAPSGAYAQPGYGPPYVIPSGYPAAAYPWAAYDPRASSRNAWGVASLITAIAGVTVMATLFWCSIVGIVFGHLGMKAARQGRATNRGMSLAGLIVGYVGLAISIVVWGGVLLLLLGMSAWEPYYWAAAGPVFLA